MLPGFCLKIGGISIALSYNSEQGQFTFDELYRPFLTDKPAQVHLEHKWDGMPGFEHWSQVYDSGGVWKLYQQTQSWGLALFSPLLGKEPYQVAIFEQEFLKGTLWTRTLPPPYTPYPFPFAYPLPEWLMCNLLSQGRGLIVHGCGLIDGDRGLLFAGNSGAGKSTTARLWKNLPGVLLLNDDRIILRREEDGIWMYGTPWHGDVSQVSPGRIRLGEIFILTQDKENHALPLTASQLVVQLFKRSFPTFWNRSGLEFSLTFLHELSQAVNGYELHFTPDHHVVQTVRQCYRSEETL
jgi:hypothetical protein